MTEPVIAQILIQTDHQHHVDFLKEHLGGLGHELTFVDDAQSVLAVLDCSVYDLLILDADRVDIIEKIRKDKGCDAPIISLAGPHEIDAAERSLQIGAQDYLREPFSPTFMKVRVSAILDQLWWKRSQADHDRLIHLEHDVEIARRIQNNFLPRELPTVAGWELAARFFPARMVAGDWYDVFSLTNQRRFGFVIADVCDKGIPSALFMALCRSLIRAFSQQNQSLSWMDTSQFQGGEDWLRYVRSVTPGVRKQAQESPPSEEDRQKNLPSAGTTALRAAVKQTNAYVLENHGDSNMFATMFYGIFDPQSGSVAYINAGHNAPALIGPNGEIKARLKSTGPAVGIVPNANFEIGHLEMQPGDTLFCFTDGVPDATSPQ
ncbi:MAG: PP2C family protein-serine/threonine phosphatase, partial [Chloroflexota bacterium]